MSNQQMNQWVYSKDYQQDLRVRLALGDLLDPPSTPGGNDGETFVSVELQGVAPISDHPLTCTLETPSSEENAILEFQGGDPEIDYGVKLLMVTSEGQQVINVVVRAYDILQQSSHYSVLESGALALKTLIGESQSGDTQIGVAVFAFPADIDPSSGWVTWDLIDQQGKILAQGNAFEYRVVSDGASNTVQAQCLVNVPQGTKPSSYGTSYKLRYTLSIPDYTTPFYEYESLRITDPAGTVPLGALSLVVIQGTTAVSQLVTSDLWDTVELQIWGGNSVLATAPVLTPNSPATARPVRTADGWLYKATITTDTIAPSLVPLGLVWRYWNAADPSTVTTERADMWIINPSIASAIQDLKAKVNKSRTTLYGHPDLLFPPETLMTWLRRGADGFNAYKGIFTSFTMVNALGPIREWWLTFAEMYALESQYLAEGEKAFDFAGAAISLTVDQTQYLETLRGVLQGRIDNEMQGIKTNLTIKGNTSGDGSADPTSLQSGAMGSVGIRITPASVWNALGGYGAYPAWGGAPIIGTTA